VREERERERDDNDSFDNFPNDGKYHLPRVTKTFDRYQKFFEDLFSAFVVVVAFGDNDDSGSSALEFFRGVLWLWALPSKKQQADFSPTTTATTETTKTTATATATATSKAVSFDGEQQR